MNYNAVICRYNEIGTKGRNRRFFVERLCESLRNRLSNAGHLHFELEHGRIFFQIDGACIDGDSLELIRKETPTIPGVSSLSPGYLVEPELAKIEAIVDERLPEIVEPLRRRKDGQPITYAMRARRSYKEFPMTGNEIERHFAARLLEQYQDFKVDLDHAELVIEVEIRKERAFVSFERIQGAGGLPAGTSGKVLALLSGGIDSPVACYEAMRRGCHVDFITFHSAPYTPPATVEKVIAITRQLNTFQKRGCLFAINLLSAQKAIRDLCQSKNRTVLYRRMMMRMATITAQWLSSEALLTGDNLGQVASQTLTNMAVINKATDMLILRPLLTFDKLQSIAIAEKIGTFDISKEDVPDSCTVFAPPDPTTKAILRNIEEDEARLDIDGLMRQCFEQSVMVTPRKLTTHPWNPYKDNPFSDEE